LEKLVSVYRGSIEESSHYGHIAIVDVSKGLKSALGDPNYITYIRSAAKPLQVINLFLNDLDKQYGFTAEEIAVMCGSHGGEEIHCNAVNSVLEKIGLSTDYLQCGSHRPFSREAASRLNRLQQKPTSLHNNCSGKHAAMLAMCVKYGWNTGNYLDPHHPVQTKLAETVAYISDLRVRDLIIGIDGCGVPVYGMPLYNMAQAFGRLANPNGLSESFALACSKVTKAMITSPHMLSAKEAIDYNLMMETKGSVIAKIGAEAVYCIGLPNKGIGIALKVIDGSHRAIPPVVMKLLVKQNILDEHSLHHLSKFVQPEIINHAGLKVGYLSAEFDL